MFVHTVPYLSNLFNSLFFAKHFHYAAYKNEDFRYIVSVYLITCQYFSCHWRSWIWKWVAGKHRFLECIHKTIVSKHSLDCVLLEFAHNELDLQAKRLFSVLHRIIECLGLKTIQSQPSAVDRHLRPEQVAQRHIQPRLEHWPGIGQSQLLWTVCASASPLLWQRISSLYLIST